LRGKINMEDLEPESSLSSLFGSDEKISSTDPNSIATVPGYRYLLKD
jgi:hypothetical protein